MGEYHHQLQETNLESAYLQEFEINGSKYSTNKTESVDWNSLTSSSDVTPSRKQNYWIIPMMGIMLYGAIMLNINPEQEEYKLQPIAARATPTVKIISNSHIFLPNDHPYEGLPEERLIVACFQALSESRATDPEAKGFGKQLKGGYKDSRGVE